MNDDELKMALIAEMPAGSPYWVCEEVAERIIPLFDAEREEVKQLQDELQARRDAAAIEHTIIDAERALADDLAARADKVLAAWDADDEQEQNDLSDEFWVAISGLVNGMARYREARQR